MLGLKAKDGPPLRRAVDTVRCHLPAAVYTLHHIHTETDRMKPELNHQTMSASFEAFDITLSPIIDAAPPTIGETKFTIQTKC